MVRSEERIERDRASALDLLMAAQGEAGTKNIAIDKKLIADVFFRLSTGLAGEILQKFTNYGVKCAIYGDFSHYTSKPLQDFIRESNRRGTDVLFTADEREAVERLAEI